MESARPRRNRNDTSSFKDRLAAGDCDVQQVSAVRIRLPEDGVNTTSVNTFKKELERRIITLFCKTKPV